MASLKAMFSRNPLAETRLGNERIFYGEQSESVMAKIKIPAESCHKSGKTLPGVRNGELEAFALEACFDRGQYHIDDDA